MLELFKCFHTENEVYQDFVVWWEHRHSMSGNYGEVQLHLNLGIHFHPKSLQIRQDSIFISSHFKSLGFLSYGFSFLMNVALKPIFFPLQILAAMKEYLHRNSMDRNMLTWQSTSSGIRLHFLLLFTKNVVICGLFREVKPLESKTLFCFISLDHWVLQSWSLTLWHLNMAIFSNLTHIPFSHAYLSILPLIPSLHCTKKKNLFYIRAPKDLSTSEVYCYIPLIFPQRCFVQ